MRLFYLALIGFFTYGAHVFMVGHAAQDFAGRKAPALAAGLIDFFGYIGARMAGVFSGGLTDRIGWESAFWFWIISTFLSSVICGALWKYKPPPGLWEKSGRPMNILFRTFSSQPWQPSSVSKETVRILVGGAPITQEFTNSIGADGFRIDAVDGVKKAKELLHGKEY